MKLSTRVGRRSYSFRDLNDLMAKANRDRSGDRLAEVAARSDAERVAARRLLAEVPLAELRRRPALPPEEDAVSRVVEEDLDESIFRRFQDKTVGELRDFVLSADPSRLTAQKLGFGLTPEMAAAVAKLCSNLDLIRGASRISVVTRANTTLGEPGRLGVRIQPNHPTDDIDEILEQTREGLSYGSGDALIGVNPARDDEETVRRLLEELTDLVERYEIPTQVCVLSHVTTQMRALERGAPMGLMFQSLAGTEAACRAFGISIEMMDEADVMAMAHCRVAGPNSFYFETGQGSELSSGTHHGIDQVTLEARCYGLARRYAPFAVNTVIGFIGPEYLFDPSEVQRAGLEDHFMGKLLGVPMGVDACATNHMSGDQNDLENQALLMAAAGANFFMGVPMGDDVLLGYRSTSFHDLAAMRETLGKRPAPELERWLEAQGLMQNGALTKRAGNPRRFGGKKRGRWLARVDVGRSGTRPSLAARLDFDQDLATARDAVSSELPKGLVRKLRGVEARTAAKGHEEFLRDPASGRRLARGEAAKVEESFTGAPADVAIVVLSGLAAGAVGEHAPTFLAALQRELKETTLTVGRPILASRGRLKVGDEIAQRLGAGTVVTLLGDRPGLRTPDSMSAYVTHRPRRKTTDAERAMVSNIHAKGLTPKRAAARVAKMIQAGLSA